MQSTWDAALVRAIVALWPEAKGTLSSAHLYQYLQAQDTPPPLNGMHTLFAVLQQDRRIAGAQGINPQSIATDGALMITWVSPDLAATQEQYRIPASPTVSLRV